MKVYNVTTTLEDFILNNVNSICADSLILIPYGIIGPIDLNDELVGNTEVIKGICTFSRDKNVKVVFCTDATVNGNKYRSAVIVDKGRLLGTCDATHTLDGTVTRGSAIRVFDTSVARFGILIDDDIYFFEAARIATLLDAEVLLMFGSSKDYGIAPQANAELNGRSGILVSRDEFEIINTDHALINGAHVFDIKVDDTFLKNRRKDIYRQLYSVIPY